MRHEAEFWQSVERILHARMQAESYYRDPILYCRERLGQEPIGKQIALANLLNTPPHRVMCDSCNGYGKSWTAGWMATWYYDTRRPDGAVLLTAPTDRQVVEVLGKEIRSAWGQRPGIYPKQVKIEDEVGHLLLGFTARDETAFAGIRRRRTMLVFDEHNGISQQFFSAARGILTGDETYWLCLGNPTDPGSAARRERDSGDWAVIRLSSFEHPNVIPDLMGLPVPVPAAVRIGPLISNMKAWGKWVGNDPLPTDVDLWEPLLYGLPVLDEIVLLAIQRAFPTRWWRPTKPEAFARILGLYPPASIHGLFDEQTLIAARNRVLSIPATATVVIACDVARYGDDATVIHARRDQVSILHEKYHGRNTQHTTGRLKELARELAETHMGGGDPHKIPIYVDDDGIGGGVLDNAGEFNFIPIHGSSNAHEIERYPNRRSELHCAFADRLEAGQVDLHFLSDESFGEICRQAMVVEYEMDALGRRKVLGKDALKKPEKLGYSPDDLDAVIYCYSSSSTWLPPTRQDRPRRTLGDAMQKRVVSKSGKQTFPGAAPTQPPTQPADLAEQVAHYRRLRGRL